MQALPSHADVSSFENLVSKFNFSTVQFTHFKFTLQ